MWKCPVCGKENETFLCGCGFDGSRDYEALPTFGDLGAGPRPSKATRRKQLQFRQNRLLHCGSCGGTGFAFDLEAMVLRCLQCGEEMAWDKNPGMPRSKPKPILSANPSVSGPKQILPQVLPHNTGFASADEMLAALGWQQKKNSLQQDAKQTQRQTGKGKPKTFNDGFSSAKEMLEALGIQLDGAEDI